MDRHNDLATMLACVGVAFLCILLVGCSSGGHWKARIGSDYETTRPSIVYSPDPNGGIGIVAMTDSVIPEDTWDNLAIGPTLEFKLTDMAGDMVDRMIPGPWEPLANAPLDVFGHLDLMFTTDGFQPIFQPGLRLDFLPQERIQPFVDTIYLKPDGAAGIDESIKVVFGASYRF